MSANGLLEEDVIRAARSIQDVKEILDIESDQLAAIIANQAALVRIERHQRQFATARGGGRITEAPARVLEFSKNISANTQDTAPEDVTVEMPFSGTVLFVDINWPTGGQGLAGVRFSQATEEVLIPHNQDRGFLSTAAFGNRYPLNEPMDKGDDYVAEFINLDTNRVHLINVYAVITRE